MPVLQALSRHGRLHRRQLLPLAVRAGARAHRRAVLQNPIGLHENRDTWDDIVSGFAKTMLERDPSLTPQTIQKFGHNMFGGDFLARNTPKS